MKSSFQNRPDRDVHSSWRRPLRRMRRELACSLRRIEASRRLMAVPVGFWLRHWAEGSQRCLRASEWLADAASRLHSISEGLYETTVAMARAPETAAGVPDHLIEITRQVLEASAWLIDVSNYVSVFTGEPGKSAGRRTIRRRPVRARSQVSTPIRRQARVSETDAARRVSRGRAPPSIRTARSSHRS